MSFRGHPTVTGLGNQDALTQILGKEVAQRRVDDEEWSCRKPPWTPSICPQTQRRNGRPAQKRMSMLGRPFASALAQNGELCGLAGGGSRATGETERLSRFVRRLTHSVIAEAFGADYSAPGTQGD